MWVVFCNVYSFSNKVICFKVFFPFFDSFRGRKPPYYAVLFVKDGIGVALQVFSMVSKIFSTILSSISQASCH